MPDHAVPVPLDEDPVEHAPDDDHGDREERGKHEGSVVSDPTLKRQLSTEITDALRAGEKVRLGALRLLSAAVVNREKELGHELDDDEFREVAAKEVKKRSEAIEAFDGAGRRELADKERAERDAIASYAPESLSEDEVDALVEEALASTGATSLKELGQVMGFVMSRAKGRVDGKVVQAKVRDRLGAPTG
jgi:uncharacterized protein